MEIEENNLDAADRLNVRYQAFKTVFDRFATGAEVLNREDVPFKSMKVEAHREDNYIDITTRDLALRIRFLTVTNPADGAMVAMLACFRIIPGSEEKEVYVCRVIFNGQGITNVKFSYSQDALNITENGELLVGQFVLEATRSDRLLEIMNVPGLIIDASNRIS